MRILHTSDWHLGHTLMDITREHEHAAFFGWLVEACVREQPDALIVTGDVFDSATPPASAERMWFELLASLRRALPRMAIIAIAGNHDSPARLSSSQAVLRELDVHVIGALPRDSEGAIDPSRVLIPIADGRGLVAAVPFLRPADVPIDADDPIAAVYGDVLAAARARRRPGQAVIALGHLYVAGAEVAYVSERRVSIGGIEAASTRLFDGDLAYVALGHIHRAQQIGRANVRYAGAPIPLALDEANYPHQVVVIDFDGERATEIRALRIPTFVEIVRIVGDLEHVLAEIMALPYLEDREDPRRPYLEIVVTLSRPEPRLRATIDAALDGKRPRLARIGVETTGHGAALAEVASSAKRLAELDPRDVFAQCWARAHDEPPSAAVLGAFERLLAAARGDVVDPAEAS